MRVGIVGAGLAGLAAGIELGRAGHDVTIFEAGDGPGGRVRTDSVDGFLLDRGFQILLEAYPECRDLLDYDRLDLRQFRPGALVRVDGGFHRLGDPLREPTQLWSTVTSPVGTLRDKLRILAYRLDVSRGPVDDLWKGVGTTTLDRFERLGFSDRMIDRFLRPLFAGITLDPDLLGSSQVADFVFRMLSAGDASVPAMGMGRIAETMAAMLPEGSLELGARVVATTPTTIAVEGADEHTFDAVIVATDATEAARLLSTPDPGWNSVTSVWFATDRAPVDEAVLVLNGEGRGPINSLAPMSAVSDDYAPTGRHSFVVSAPSLDADLPDAFRRQLREWFGSVADTYEVLRVDRIEKAQPKQLPGHDARAGEVVDGHFVAGDHRRDASLNGAIGSGRAVARSVIAARS